LDSCFADKNFCKVAVRVFGVVKALFITPYMIYLLTAPLCKSRQDTENSLPYKMILVRLLFVSYLAITRIEDAVNRI